MTDTPMSTADYFDGKRDGYRDGLEAAAKIADYCARHPDQHWLNGEDASDIIAQRIRELAQTPFNQPKE